MLKGPKDVGGDRLELKVDLVDLRTLFATSHVVSLHAPALTETEGIVTRDHLESLQTNASLINTARGALIDEATLADVLRRRDDLIAVLDVTAVEPPPADSPLWSLSNAILLPHIAGSMGRECWRMGERMLDELKRFVNGDPLAWEITREKAARLA